MRKQYGFTDYNVYSAVKNVVRRRNLFESIKKPEIKEVIFNNPATIVKWSDGTKTVVKCDKETFDQEKGLAMAIVKKFMGTNDSQSNYNDIFKKWCDNKTVAVSKTLVKTVSVKEYAEKCDISEKTVYSLIKEHKIEAMKIRGKWEIVVGNSYPLGD